MGEKSIKQKVPTSKYYLTKYGRQSLEVTITFLTFNCFKRQKSLNHSMGIDMVSNRHDNDTTYIYLFRPK